MHALIERQARKKNRGDLLAGSSAMLLETLSGAIA